MWMWWWLWWCWWWWWKWRWYRFQIYQRWFCELHSQSDWDVRASPFQCWEYFSAVKVFFFKPSCSFLGVSSLSFDFDLNSCLVLWPLKPAWIIIDQFRSCQEPKQNALLQIDPKQNLRAHLLSAHCSSAQCSNPKKILIQSRTCMLTCSLAQCSSAQVLKCSVLNP